MCKKEHSKKKNNIKDDNFYDKQNISNINNNLCCDSINKFNDKIIYLKDKIKFKNKIINKLKKKKIDLKKKIDDLNLRHKASLENLCKLNEININKVYKYSLEQFSKELLVILDGLKSSIIISKSKKIDYKVNYKGLILILKNFLSILKKFGIVILDNFIKFDPNYHQAISVVKTSDKNKDNYILEVLQDGYLINDRLLRPAMVKVLKYKK